VKAVGERLHRSVTLYAWDASDPILRTWMKAFPGLSKPRSEIPAALMPHLRYPPDLFEVQRQILTQYNVLSAQPSTAGRTSGPAGGPEQLGRDEPDQPDQPGRLGRLAAARSRPASRRTTRP